MSPRLRCFATLATVCATALLGPAALGQPQGATKVPPPDLLGHLAEYWETSTWFGSATCTVMGMNGTGYSGTETHKWEIIPWDIYTTASMAYFAENWTATGMGQGGGKHWTVNAKGPSPGYLQFWLPPGSSLLNIARSSSQQTDHHGSTGGNSTQVWEVAFPGPVLMNNFQPIVATPGVVNSIQGTSSLTTTGGILSNEPGDGTNSWTCSWNFQYHPVYPSPPPGPHIIKR